MQREKTARRWLTTVELNRATLNDHLRNPLVA